MVKFLKRLIVVLLILGLLVFFGVPYLLGTGWAKEHIQTAMAKETGVSTVQASAIAGSGAPA